MDKQAFLRAVQARAARASVGPSTVRRQGEGCASAARGFLETLDLKCFSCTDENKFLIQLDEKTQCLKQALPINSQSWGLARKLLNIFLRDCFYTTYLKEEYKLDRIEFFLEIPLDSITTAEIRRSSSMSNTLRWRGIKTLDSEMSSKYQRAAESEARKRKVARVHLDAVWWGVREE